MSPKIRTIKKHLNSYCFLGLLSLSKQAKNQDAITHNAQFNSFLHYDILFSEPFPLVAPRIT